MMNPVTIREIAIRSLWLSVCHAVGLILLLVGAREDCSYT